MAMAEQMPPRSQNCADSHESRSSRVVLSDRMTLLTAAIGGVDGANENH